MTQGRKHRITSWCLLGAILLAVAALIGLGIYSIAGSEETRPGSQGPLMQSSPGRDPAPLDMRPRKRP